MSGNVKKDSKGPELMLKSKCTTKNTNKFVKLIQWRFFSQNFKNLELSTSGDPVKTSASKSSTYDQRHLLRGL